jgi:hypothetical protein
MKLIGRDNFPTVAADRIQTLKPQMESFAVLKENVTNFQGPIFFHK